MKKRNLEDKVDTSISMDSIHNIMKSIHKHMKVRRIQLKSKIHHSEPGDVHRNNVEKAVDAVENSMKHIENWRTNQIPKSALAEVSGKTIQKAKRIAETAAAGLFIAASSLFIVTGRKSLTAFAVAGKSSPVQNSYLVGIILIAIMLILILRKKK